MSDSNWANFVGVIKYVRGEDDYKHLFNDQDQEIFNAFLSASREAQTLYVALFLRKHRWIRTKSIKYPQIATDLTPLFEELVQIKVLESIDSCKDLDEILNCMENHELKRLIQKLKTVNLKNQSTNNRSAMIEALTKHATSFHSVIKSFGNPKTNPVKAALVSEAKKIVGATAKRLHDEAWNLFSRAFYLFYPPQVNEDEQGQVISYAFFLQSRFRDLATNTFPQYKISRKTVIYQTREELIEYQKACHLESQIMRCLEEKDHQQVIETHYYEAFDGYKNFIDSPAYNHVKNIPVYLRNATAGHVYLRCLTHVIGAFESKRMYKEAVEACRILVQQNVLCLTYKGKFYERLALDLERYLKQPQHAFKALVAALDDVHVKEHLRYALYLRAKALHKNVKDIPWNPIRENAKYQFNSYRTVRIEAPTLKKTIPGRRFVFMHEEGENHCSVENAAMEYYLKNQGFLKGLHAESKVFHAIFTLLLWDEIYFDQLDDVFRAYHQSLPLDFVSEEFYPRRKQLIDTRLATLESMDKVDIAVELVASWKANFGTLSLVDWKLDLDDLKEVLYCIGIKALTTIFKRLLCNFRFNRSGFPDLVLWNVNQQKILLVEVKGPGDSLSPKQIMWLEYFTTNNIPCEVAYVQPRKK